MPLKLSSLKFSASSFPFDTVKLGTVHCLPITAQRLSDLEKTIAKEGIDAKDLAVSLAKHLLSKAAFPVEIETSNTSDSGKASNLAKKVELLGDNELALLTEDDLERLFGELIKKNQWLSQTYDGDIEKNADIHEVRSLTSAATQFAQMIGQHAERNRKLFERIMRPLRNPLTGIFPNHFGEMLAKQRTFTDTINRLVGDSSVVSNNNLLLDDVSTFDHLKQINFESSERSRETISLARATAQAVAGLSDTALELQAAYNNNARKQGLWTLFAVLLSILSFLLAVYSAYDQSQTAEDEKLSFEGRFSDAANIVRTEFDELQQLIRLQNERSLAASISSDNQLKLNKDALQKYEELIAKQQELIVELTDLVEKFQVDSGSPK